MTVTIHQWIDRGKDLPALSGSIARLLSLTQKDDSNVSQLAEVIKKDVSLSAATLRITNSSAFGLLSKITTIDQAVVLLGFNSIRNIALGVGVLNLFPPHDETFLSKIWQRSLVTGLAAREISRLKGNKNNEDAFTGGLLHDIGLIAFFSYDNKKASELLKEAENNGCMNLDSEKKLMGINHVEAGGLLAEKWKLPEDIILAIRHHHDDPWDASFSDNGNLVPSVNLGAQVGDIFYLGNKKESIKMFIENCHRLGIPDGKTNDLLHDIHPQLIEIAAHFDITVSPGNTYEDILCKANEEIVNITISNEATKYHLTQAFEREKELAAKLEESNRNLKILASKDSLTGLYNRQFLNEWLEKEWHRSIRYNYPLSIAMVDIDDFKRVNDTYGHQVGDMVLKEIANILKENLRMNDCLARYGGEEFAILLPQTNLKEAYTVTSRFSAAVRELNLSSIGDDNLSLSISCGVSTAFPGKGREGEHLDALIKRADDALLEAKRSGKDQVVYKDI